MKNKFNIRLLFLTPYLLILLLFSCNFFIENGGLGVSLDILESQKKGVFIQEYKPVSNPLKINDSLILNIKSAWLEYTWRYEGSENEKARIVNKNDCQIIIVTDDKSLKGYNNNWLIGDANDSMFYGGTITTL